MPPADPPPTPYNSQARVDTAPVFPLQCCLVNVIIRVTLNEIHHCNLNAIVTRREDIFLFIMFP